VKELHRLASRSYAFEGRCFVIAAGSILDRSHLPDDLQLLNEMPGEGPWLAGGSMIIGPGAEVLAGPVDNKETLVIAEIDPEKSAQESMTLDVSGHYSRPDVFKLVVNENPQGQDKFC
jgi:predicted amidohydrolase